MGDHKAVRKVKYLGVTWSRRLFLWLMWKRLAFGKMRAFMRMMGRRNVSYEIGRRIYEGMYVAIVVYAAGAWALIDWK